MKRKLENPTCSSNKFLPDVEQRNRRYRSSPSRNGGGGSYQDDDEEDESDRRAISLSPVSSRKSTGAKSYGSR